MNNVYKGNTYQSLPLLAARHTDYFQEDLLADFYDYIQGLMNEGGNLQVFRFEISFDNDVSYDVLVSLRSRIYEVLKGRCTSPAVYLVKNPFKKYSLVVLANPVKQLVLGNVWDFIRGTLNLLTEGRGEISDAHGSKYYSDQPDNGCSCRSGDRETLEDIFRWISYVARLGRPDGFKHWWRA